MQVFSEKHAPPARQRLGSKRQSHSLDPRQSPGWSPASEPSFGCTKESKPQASFRNVSPQWKHRFCTLKFPLYRNYCGL